MSLKTMPCSEIGHVANGELKALNVGWRHERALWQIDGARARAHCAAAPPPSRRLIFARHVHRTAPASPYSNNNPFPARHKTTSS